MTRQCLIGMALVLLAGSPGFASETTKEFEDDMDKITEGTLRLVDKREETQQGTLRYSALEKNIGELNGELAKTRDLLSLLETTTDPTVKEDLTNTVKNEILEMSSTLEDAQSL